MSEKSICIFIPAYNAAKFLRGVVEAVPQQVWSRVVSCWIVNDGSLDATGEEARRLARDYEKVNDIHFSKNSGYGAVVKRGLTLCRSEACDIAVCLHGDGQYPASMIPEFVECMVREGFDILQGSRHAGGSALAGGMPLYKYVAGKILTGLGNRIFGLSMTDYHSGYLFYSRRALQAIPFEQFSGGFQIDLEMIAAARARGLAVGEKAIPTRYADEVSYLSPVVYGMCVLNVLRQYCRGRYR